MEKKYIAYYRVSTKRQGKSGLGLGAQQEIVKAFVKQNGGFVLSEFTEVESGKSNTRPKLAEAIQEAKDIGATLVTAKLDRLSRDVEFIFNIKNSGVDFLCCDMPEMNTLMLGVMGSVAQSERERISSRIKDAFEVKKAKGEKLGNPSNLTREGQLKGAQANRLKALNNPEIQKATAQALSFRKDGCTLEEIAEKLNKLTYRTPKGKKWAANSVHRILSRV